jgi:Protein of unknown function (DUF3040)
MGLPDRQQLILDQIERALQAADPRLKSMFAAFGRLAHEDHEDYEDQDAHDAQQGPGPVAEVIRGRPVRRTVIICLLVISMLSVLLIGIRSTSNDCPGLSSDQVVASAAVRYAGCSKSTDAWSKGAR